MVVVVLLVFCSVFPVFFFNPLVRTSKSARPAAMFLGFALAFGGGWTTASAGTQTATSTTLAVTSGGSPVTSISAGTVVTLTASVKAGITPVTIGLVNFCDALAAYCTDIHVLGTAQLTSAGTAVLKFRSAIGSHSYKAAFAGTSPYSGSVSSAEALTVTGISPTVTAMAQSGSPGSYTLTATVASQAKEAGIAPPTGLVSFLDISNGDTSLASVALGNGATGLSFLNTQTPQTGYDPWSVATADFNGDGIPDLAVANQSDGTMTILLGNGDGTFAEAASSPIAIGNSTFYVAVGDFNQDGKPDLAVASGFYGGAISIFLGNGNGTFTQAAGSPISVSTPYVTDAIAVADINGDGIPDIAAANDGYEYGASSVTVLLGNGDGTFTTVSASSTVGEGPVGIIAGDFNGDGKPDLATANFYDGTVTVLLGNGDGTFTQAASSPIIVGSFPWTLSTADFNRDGKADLAVANTFYTSGSPGTISVLLGNGDGTFIPSADSPVTVGHSPESAAVGDFNGDGIPDLAAANNNDDTVTILLGAGDGTFTTAAVGPVRVGDFPQSTVTADFTGSGISDLAVGNENDSVSVLLTMLESATATVNGIAPIGAGAPSVEASYAGDSNYGGSVSGTVALPAGLAPVVISPASGTYTSVQSVTLSESVPGATIYYAASGTVNTTSWVLYTAPIQLTIGGAEYIQAYATETGYQQSNYSSATYNLNLPLAPSPVFSPAAGNFAGVQSVTISDSAPGAAIYYTTNGSSPTTSSTLYTAPIAVSTSETISAVAVASGYTVSLPASAQYIIASSPSSFIYTLAGNGFYGYSGDGGAATLANLNQPGSSVSDGAGNLYIADSINNVIRKVSAGTGLITTIAGTGIAGYSGDNGAATSAKLNYPTGLSLDSAGDLYFAEETNNVVRMVAATTGVITTVAGNGTAGYGGDDNTATNAELSYPVGTALDSSGNLYIADSVNVRIREVAAKTAIITTVAGNGQYGYAGDGGPATSANLESPQGVAVDTAGNVYIADTYNSVVRKVNATTGVISTVAGSYPGNGYFGGAYSGDGGPATNAQLYWPEAVTLDSAGNLYIADTYNSAIRKVTSSSGIITTVAGFGGAFSCYALVGDGGPATNAGLCFPSGISTDGTGNLYIADSGFSRIRVAAVAALPPASATAAPVFTVAAGTYASPQTISISDVTPGASIYLTMDGTSPSTVSSGYDGSINVSGNVIIQAVAAAPGHLTSTPVSATYIITSSPAKVINTIAGTGVSGLAGSGGPAKSAQIGQTAAITIDGAGDLFFTDTTNSVVWEVAAATGNASIVAGNGTPGFSGDGGPATSAQLNSPSGVAVDSAGNLYISDSNNGVVREVLAGSGLIQTFAGVYGQSGYPGHIGDGGPATSAYLSGPQGLALDAAGNLYIADSYNSEVRVVSAATGIITGFAGNGNHYFSGEGGAATSASLGQPNTLAFDNAGNLYIASYAIGRVCKVSAATGILTTVAGNGNRNGSSGDGGPATAAEIYPFGLALDSVGNLYISNWTGSIREVAAGTGTITKVFGNGYPGYSGDGGAAGIAQLWLPQGIVFDGSGNLYIADSENFRIREVTAPTATATPVISPASGSYTSVQTATITDSTAGAIIYYTTDGTAPSNTSNVYSAPVTISSTTTLLAIAIAPGSAQSAVASATYTIQLPIAPAVTITPSPTSITTAQSLTVTVDVNGPSGSSTPTGSVTLTSESYSTKQTLTGGAATFNVAAGTLPVGANTLTATYTPDATGGAHYTSATQTTTVNVTQAVGTATPTVTLTPSATTVTNAQPVSVSVSVAGASGQPTSTGSVTLAGGSYSSRQSLSNGAVTFSIPAGALSEGANTLTANYSGDIDYSPASSTATVTVAPVLVTSPAPPPVAPGGSTSATATFSAGSTYSGTMNLTCTLSDSPTGAQSLPTCSLNPASIAIATGSTASTVVTVNTTAASSSSALLSPASHVWKALSGGGVLALACLIGVPSVRRRKALMMVALFAIVVTGILGCGGGGSTQTPPPTTPATTAGTYTFSVVGTDSSNAKITASANVTVTVK